MSAIERALLVVMATMAVALSLVLMLAGRRSHRRVSVAYLTVIAFCLTVGSVANLMPDVFPGHLVLFQTWLPVVYMLAGVLLSMPVVIVLASTMIAAQLATVVVVLAPSGRLAMHAVETNTLITSLVAQGVMVLLILVLVHFREAFASARARARAIAAGARDLRHAMAMADVARREAEEANRLKSELLARVSHELRTPLNAINGFSEAMSMELFGPIQNERYHDYVRHIREGGVYLRSLIDDVLEFARMESGATGLALEPFDLARELRDASDLLCQQVEAAGLTLLTQLPQEGPSVVSDRRAVRQIVTNLMSNAIKYTAPGGRLRVGIADATANHVCFFVSDTGQGIAPDRQAAVLEPFVQVGTPYVAGDKGLGLGLSIVRSLSQRLGGQLRLQSRLGEGTTVSVILPRTGPPADPPAGRPSDPGRRPDTRDGGDRPSGPAGFTFRA